MSEPSIFSTAISNSWSSKRPTAPYSPKPPNPRSTALDRAKAQYMFFVVKRAPSGGWKLDAYSATYSVLRDGKVALSHTLSLVLS